MTCEPCTFSQGQEVDCLPTSSSVIRQSWPTNGNHMPAPSCESAQPKDGSPDLRSLKGMCAPLNSGSGPAEWIASQRASLARIFRQRAKAPGSTESEAASTVKSFGQLTMFDQDSSGLRTVQKFGPEDVTVSLPTLWRVDTPGAMEFLARLMSEQDTFGTAGGASLPTLTVCGNYNRKGSSAKSGDGIATALKKLPTPLASSGRKGGPNSIHGSGSLSLPAAIARLPTVCATDWKAPYSAEGYAKQMQVRSKPLRDTLVHSTGHRLTSAFAEWWMGWPLGWTASNAPETAKSRLQRRRRGSRSEGR